MQPVNRGRFPVSGSTCGHPEKLQYSQSQLKNIPDKVGDAWSEEAVALYIEILKTRLRGDDLTASTKELQLNARKHGGRILPASQATIARFQKARGRQNEQMSTPLKRIL